MSNKNKKANNYIPKNKKTLAVYLTLRFLVTVCMVAQSIHGNWNNVLLCILTLILFTIPSFVSHKFEIEMPDTLEIIVYLFIFSAKYREVNISLWMCLKVDKERVGTTHSRCEIVIKRRIVYQESQRTILAV